MLRPTVLLIISIISFSSTASADLADELSRLVGYSIVASKTIIGYRDENGKSEESFQGCQFGRKVIFEGNRALTCAEYGYQYAYRPTAVILSNGSSLKMIVEDEVYDMQK